MFAASKTASVSGGYQISRSLRFNAADSNTLTRTPATAGSRTTYSLSFWVKNPFTSGSDNPVWGQSSIARESLAFQGFSYAHNPIQWIPFTGFEFRTTQAFRDDSAWYHIVAVGDSTNATAGDRARLYVNGVRVTAFDLSSTITQNAQTGQLNTTVLHYIGKTWSSDGAVPRFYLTEMNFIDGQALTAASFGETNADTGVWQPKAYSGSYGTNGFYLNFSDNSNTTAATLGADYSGNGNNWTPNNFSVTAGAGNDSLVDSPTSFGTDTGVGGTVRGNYCTLNPLAKASQMTVRNGNLDCIADGSWRSVLSTFGMTTGKWYWEQSIVSGVNMFSGIAKGNMDTSSFIGYIDANGWGYYNSNGYKWNNGSGSAYGASVAAGDIVGIAFDADAGTLVFYKNGTSQGTAFSGLTSGPYFPAASSETQTVSINFGQRPFAYTAPSGFKALCTQNLPTPTIGATTATQAGKYFDTSLYTGNAGALTVTNSGFQPDFLWIKRRDASGPYHNAFDSVRGVNKILFPNATDAEFTSAAYLTSFNSGGFTLGAGDTGTNANAALYVGWQWRAGNSSGSTNTAGSITSTVSANTTSGFSVVTYTATGSNATVGHGLGAVPSMIIVKSRTLAGGHWTVYHSALGNTKGMLMNTTDSAYTNSGYWNNTTPTSTVFSIGTDGSVNQNTQNQVAYCFAEVAGYSKFGSYTGNGSADGAFVYCGFRPRFIMIKRTDSTANWYMYDTSRSPSNVTGTVLFADGSFSEADIGPTNYLIDIDSNGLKLRNNYASVNASGGTYIFMAFAETPFKYSLAR
jgi:hypothetical protein